MIIGTIATYSAIFGKSEPIPNTSKLLSGISSDLLISYYSFINTVCFLQPYNRNLELRIIGEILHRFPEKERYKIGSKIFHFIDIAKGKPIKFFPLLSLLSCIEDELRRNYRGSIEPISKEEELNILLSIFVKNQEIDEEITSRLGDLYKVSGDEKLYRLIWTINFPHSEFLYVKDIYTAAYSSLRFLNFINQSPKLLNCAKSFSESSVEYLKELFLLFINARVKHDWKMHSNFDEDKFSDNKIVKRITYDLDDNHQFKPLDLNDFKFLRMYPILKVNGKYSVSNWNFIIDKFYPGIVYDFLNTTKVREAFNGADDKAKDNAYLSFIGKNFGETILFKEIFAKILITQSPILIPGDDQGKNFDLYCRIDRHVFLFEYKNFMLPKKLTYDEIKKVIDERLVSNQGKKKGILQLVTQILKLQESPKSFETFSDFGRSKTRLVIYPIIIYADPVLGTHGINSYLNKLLRNEVRKMNPKLRFRVQDLVLVSEHFFLDNSELFVKRKIDLVYLINHYYRLLFNKRKDSLRYRKHPINIHSPFEEVIQEYVNRKNRNKKFSTYYFNHIRKGMFPNETLSS